MAKFKPQYRRLIYIDQKIRQGTRIERYPNCREMAEEQEVSRKTIQRDVDYLKWEMNAPIEYDPVKHGYYYTEPDFKLPAINIRRSDLFAICIAEKVLRQYEATPVYDNLVTVFEALEGAMPEKVSVDPSWLHDRFSFFAEASPEMNPEAWQSSFEALRQNRSLKFMYRNPGWRKKYERTVDPYHAISYRAEWYLVGRCHYMKSIRIYAISRMSDVRMTDDYFWIPEDFDFKRMAGSHFGIMFGKEEHRVQVRFDADAAPYVRERQWHPTQTIEDFEDGGILLSFTTNHLLEVRRWVLSWGEGATVEAPPELVEDITRHLRNALKGYE